MTGSGVILITDFANCTGENPLRNNIQAFFTDRSTVQIDSELLQLARQVGNDCKIPVYEGVYWQCPGPSLETPFDVRTYISIGANAFGMSSVPEVMASSLYNMRQVVLSVSTNMACGTDPDEEEVTLQMIAEAARGVEDIVQKYVEGLV